MAKLFGLLAKYNNLIENYSINTYLPRVVPPNYLNMRGDFGGEFDNVLFSEAGVKPMLDHLDRKQFRYISLFTLLTGNLFNYPSERLLPLVHCSEMITSAGLIHDDIEDGAEFRSGKPCVYKIYGTEVAINAGNLLFQIPNRMFADLDYTDGEKFRLMKEYNDSKLNHFMGTALELY